MSIEGREALQRVVTRLRTNEHRLCTHPVRPHRHSGHCPWPLMWDEDATELYQKLTEAGYEITAVKVEEEPVKDAGPCNCGGIGCWECGQ